MNERDLLRHIYDRSDALAAFPQVLLGPGDDCAVLGIPPAGRILLTVDHLVEARHFPRFTAEPTRDVLDLIARKALARSVSDIAAMGGSPLASLATACLPPAFPQPLADHLFDRMNHWAAHWRAPLIGGDIAQSAATAAGDPPPLVLTTTLIGLPHPARGPVLRSTAREGDGIFVTGSLGNSFASGRHVTFEPRLPEAAWLCAQGPHAPSAMIDLSDGLGLDSHRLGAASNLTLVIDAALIPRHTDCADWRSACADGEDYELLFTAPADADFSPLLRALGTAVTRIGRVHAGRSPGSVIQTPDGQTLDGQTLGWNHGDA